MTTHIIVNLKRECRWIIGLSSLLYGALFATVALAQESDVVAISQNTSITLGLLIAVGALIMGQVGLAWHLVAKATAALPRIEAYLNFVTKIDNSEAHADIKASLKELDAKLEKITELTRNLQR
jgi:hypothetical protein